MLLLSKNRGIRELIVYWAFFNNTLIIGGMGWGAGFLESGTLNWEGTIESDIMEGDCLILFNGLYLRKWGFLIK